MRSTSFLIALLICSLAWSHVCAAPSNESTTEKVFLGYVAGLPRDINFGLYTHLAHAFLGASDDGSLNLREHVPNRQLTHDAHQAGVKVLISLGGGGSEEPFIAMSQGRQAEDRYVQEVMNVVDGYDYDGIDFDWEYPDTKTEIVCFERMTRQFRKLLDELGEKKQRPMLLTMAVNCHPDRLKWLTNELLLENMDWINLMTYDFTGPWTDFAGHQSPLYLSSKVPEGEKFSTDSAIQYLIEGRNYPAERLAVGLPLYGRVFAVEAPYATTVDAPQPRRDAINYRQIAELKAEPNWKRTWDDETKNPWLIAKDGSEIICYDDEQSTSLKTEWAMKQGLRGVFFWQIAGDRLSDGSNPLQEAAKEKMRK
ncbi:glycoside hydrolase family 18 protein [Bythopirellula goksoeyrii]|uniref:chitinase n=1 Tax=Bythopirellula goksoeyrii TaxID=1400387 RepID=A0A5B9Q994_9BACT|nr:glycoside hydrolase family 18 protein [Bythopirellula goksoeyrii]QEG33516.1 Chitinase B precursor [Bythopirellula goksoeyrii]